MDLGIDIYEKHKTNSEFEAMTAERQFTLLHHLSLSEHSLYCNCNCSIMDDLSIIHKQLPGGIGNEKMEKYFGRVRSEFQFARTLYFRSLNQDPSSEESLRVSFRLCFGIFDKLAQAICEFYKLEKKKNENIYFNSFWNNVEKRWEQLNAIQNVHLTALYSIATDLDKSDGEFGFYKAYRNALEHDLILFTDTSESTSEKTVQIETFKVDTLHLLQLCRAAIFSFAFCIRDALVQNKKE